jgi:hypothetical protein
MVGKSMPIAALNAMLNPIKLLFVVMLLMGGETVQAQNAQPTDSRKALDETWGMLGKNPDWKSEELAGKAKHIMTEYPASSEALTAKLFYAGYLQALQKPQDMNEEQRLYREITSTSPSSWQASLAWLNLTAIYGFEGNYRQEALVAGQALSKIDFKALESSTDPDFQRLQNIYSTPASDIKDAFKVLLASAHLEVGDVDQAQNVLGTVQNDRLKKGVAAGIDYKRKVLARKQSLPKPLVPKASAASSPDTKRGTPQ